MRTITIWICGFVLLIMLAVAASAKEPPRTTVRKDAWSGRYIVEQGGQRVTTCRYDEWMKRLVCGR